MKIRVIVASSVAVLMRIVALILVARSAHLFIFSAFDVPQVPSEVLLDGSHRALLLSTLEAAAIWFGARPLSQLLVARLSFGVIEDRDEGEPCTAELPDVQKPRLG
jgi:hypothetical protein